MSAVVLITHPRTAVPNTSLPAVIPGKGALSFIWGVLKELGAVFCCLIPFFSCFRDRNVDVIEERRPQQIAAPVALPVPAEIPGVHQSPPTVIPVRRAGALPPVRKTQEEREEEMFKGIDTLIDRYIEATSLLIQQGSMDDANRKQMDMKMNTDVTSLLLRNGQWESFSGVNHPVFISLLNKRCAVHETNSGSDQRAVLQVRNVRRHDLY